MTRLPALLVLMLVSVRLATHDILRGRVMDTSGIPVVGAQVLARSATDGTARTTTSDSVGAWMLDWPSGPGDYLVRIAATGHESVTQRIRRAGTDSVLVVDVVLARTSIARLPRIVTTAAAPRIDRTPPREDVGAKEQFGTDPDLLPPWLSGALGAFATEMSDVITTNGGISVLGTGPTQNAVTLNGFAFPGSQIPRDIKMRARISASSYDPSIGWFSGARTNVQLAPGGLFTSRTARATIDAPAMQSGDPIAAAQGNRVSRADISLAGDGPLFGPFTYNAGLQVTRTASHQATLASSGADAFASAGIAPDSVARLMRLLSAAAVPVGGTSDLQAIDHVVVLSRIDHAPYDWSTLEPARTTASLTVFGDWTRQGAIGRSVSSTAAHGGKSVRQIGLLEAEVSHYSPDGALFTARTGASVDHSASEPELALPDGRVRVASSGSGTNPGGLTTLAFGGNAGLRSDSRRWTWESGAEWQLYPAGYATHRVKLAGDIRLDGFVDEVAPNALGTFSFNSLADLAANTPSSFSRTSGARIQHGREWNAFASAGDLWRVNPNLQLLYGVRVEGNAFAGGPPSNADIASDFDARTDATPRGVAVLPRVGFTFAVPGGAGRPLGTLRGGTGAFRNLLDPRLIGAPFALTGLPNGTARLSCVGAGVPTPDWSAYSQDPSAVPTQCTSGVDGTLRDGAPDVRILDPSLQPQLAWRSNLAWASNWRGLGYALGGVYSSDRYQPGTVDLNFAGTQRFTIADEGRPVFVDPSSIVGSTGAVTSVDARRVASYGQVNASTSNLRAISRQLTAAIMPPLVRLPGGGLFAESGLSYSLSS
ncbi:MAG: carboxypeptidase-like regulatory domain-containing protein, partial [bacterium]